MGPDHSECYLFFQVFMWRIFREFNFQSKKIKIKMHNWKQIKYVIPWIIFFKFFSEIFYTYINKPTRVIRVSRSWLKQIELFLMGDSGPEIFYEIQKDVTKTLETDFYPVFLISESMYRMLEEAHENNIKISEKIDHDEDSLLTNLGK